MKIRHYDLYTNVSFLAQNDYFSLNSYVYRTNQYYFMKRVLLPMALLGMIALCTVLSCKKTETKITPVTPVPSLNTLFSGFRYTPQSFTVAAGKDVTVFGTVHGTVLHFYPNSFRNAKGEVITSGSIDLQLTELYTPADIIRNRITTMMPTGEILQSAGQVLMKATMNGQEVYTWGYGIGFKQHDTSTALMGLFYGSTGKNDSVVTWAQSEAPVNHGTQRVTSPINGGTSTSKTDTCFFFQWCRSLTRANCAWFVDPYASKVPVAVVLPDWSFNATNTQIYLVLPKTNTGWAGNAVLSNVGSLGVNDTTYIDSSKTLFLKSVGSFDVVPPGLNYELVVMANKDSKYYYWSTSGVIPYYGIYVSAALTEATQDSINVWLKKL